MPRVITCVVTGGEEEGKGEVRKRGGGGRGREGEERRWVEEGCIVTKREFVSTIN